jgi:hypothetical protein
MRLPVAAFLLSTLWLTIARCDAALVNVYSIGIHAGDNPGSEWSPDQPVTTLDVLHAGPGRRDETLRVLGPFADDPLTNEYDAGVDLSLSGLPDHEKLQAFFTLALFDIGQTDEEPEGNVEGTYTPGQDAAALSGPSMTQTTAQVSGAFDLTLQGTLETLINGEQTPTYVYQMDVRLPSVGSAVTFPLPPLGNSLFDRTHTPPEPGWQWGVMSADVQIQTTAVPEPSSLGLFGVAGLFLLAAGRGRRSNGTRHLPAAGEP